MNAAEKNAFSSASMLGFEELIAMFETRVFQLGFYLTGAIDGAESVLSNVFANLFTQPHDGTRILLEREVLRLAVAEAHEWFTAAERPKQAQDGVEQLLADLDVNALLQAANTDMESSDYLTNIGNSILSLPFAYKAAIVLRDVFRCSADDCRVILDISAGLFSSRLRRARVLLNRGVPVAALEQMKAELPQY